MRKRRPTNLTLDPAILAEIDAAAREDGMTRSTWLEDAGRAKLIWRDWRRLTELIAGKELEVLDATEAHT